MKNRFIIKIFILANIVLSCFISSQLCAVMRFEIQFSQEHSHDVDVNLYNKDKRIGFISYTKTPIVPFYIIHSLYVQPQYRGQGYGKKLLLYVCDIIKTEGGRRAYIQPGPFEIVNGCAVNVDSLYQEKIQRLIELYKKCGFKSVFYPMTLLASMLYTIMGIQEDPRYLMVKDITS
jgi:GNAT superfamily N-acetyltransferase